MSNALEKLFEDLKGFKKKRLMPIKEEVVAEPEETEEEEVEEEEEQEEKPKMLMSLTEMARFTSKPNKQSKSKKRGK